MKALITIIVLIGISSCKYGMTTKEHQLEYPILIDSQEKITGKIIVIQDCQYIITAPNSGTIFTHMGNCNNPIHKYNVGDTVKH